MDAERTITYTAAYVRADSSVWCMQENADTGTESVCRMVVDTESGLTLFLPDYLIDVNATQPVSLDTGQPLPLFRWATGTDLPVRTVTS